MNAIVALFSLLLFGAVADVHDRVNGQLENSSRCNDSVNSTHQLMFAVTKLKYTYSTWLRSTKVVSRRQGTRACLVILAEKQYADHRSEDQPVQCELHTDDRKDGARTLTVTIDILTSSWARENNVLSGARTTFDETARLDDFLNEVMITKSAPIRVLNL